MLAGPGLQDSPSLSRPSSAHDGSRHMLPMPPSTMSNGHSRPNGNHMQVHGAPNGLQHSSEAGTVGAIIAVHYRILIMQSSHIHAQYYRCAPASTCQAVQICTCDNRLRMQQSELVSMSLLRAYCICLLCLLKQKCFWILYRHLEGWLVAR